MSLHRNSLYTRLDASRSRGWCLRRIEVCYSANEYWTSVAVPTELSLLRNNMQAKGNKLRARKYISRKTENRVFIHPHFSCNANTPNTVISSLWCILPCDSYGFAKGHYYWKAYGILWPRKRLCWNCRLLKMYLKAFYKYRLTTSPEFLIMPSSWRQTHCLYKWMTYNVYDVGQLGCWHANAA
jgi:hypothetical protein